MKNQSTVRRIPRKTASKARKIRQATDAMISRLKRRERRRTHTKGRRVRYSPKRSRKQLAAARRRVHKSMTRRLQKTRRARGQNIRTGGHQ